MRTLLLGVLVAASACDGSPPRGDSAVGDTAAPDTASADSASVARADTTMLRVAREIYIDSVMVANPLVIYGRARTFENNVSVRANDARGGLIVEYFTTSAGEMGHHNPFVSRLFLTRDPGPHVIASAFEYSANDGSVRSLVSDTIPWTVQPVHLSVHFATGPDCESTTPFTRTAPRAVAIARLLAEVLVGGPDAAERAAGATQPFPRGSRVNSVILRDGVLTVDFNERLQNVGGSCAARAIRAAVTRTLSQLPAVRSVVITAGGSEEMALQP